MVSEIQEAVETPLEEVWIPEFGTLETQHLEANKKFQGRLYRLSPDTTKSISEIFGFTLKFDLPSIRNLYMDVFKTEAHILFEIDRNTKPTDLGLRYMRDRWTSIEPSARERDALRPWIKTSYVARYLPEKVFILLAEQLHLGPEEREHFYVRVNLKDRLAGLIAEDQYVEQFPTGAFQVFAYPQGHAAVIPVIDLQGNQSGAQAPTASSGALNFRQTSGTPVEPGVKYATYSKSEIDRMLKQQSDSISSTLGGKISGQQRAFLEAVAAQEKSFSKLLDKLAAQMEDTRDKLEAHGKHSQAAHKAELEQFKQQLDKELDAFKAHVNKSILPVPKMIDEKTEAFKTAVAKQPKQENLKPFLTQVLLVLLLAIAAGSAACFVSYTQLQSQLAARQK